jgi:hypothetical protein
LFSKIKLIRRNFIMVDANVQVISDGLSLGESNPLPQDINEVSKTATIDLFGGAISASVNEATATVIDMKTIGANAGNLQAVETSGTGSYSLAIYAKDIATGVFVPMLTAAGAARTVAIPDGGGSVDVTDLRANYIKFVPTLTGTSTMTFKFTPTPQ